MKRIMFINRRFENGGAERQLITLTKVLDKAVFEVCVATFYEGGGLYPEIQAVPGIQLLKLRKHGRWDVVGFLRRLWRAARRFRPQIIVGYMTVANLLALMVGRVSGAKVVWSIRSSNVQMERYDWLSRITARLECSLARCADLVIFNSHAGLRHSLDCGFPEASCVVIWNGIDAGYFTEDVQGGRRVRSEWRIADEHRLVGIVARLDPMKDHETFLAAASILLRKHDDVRFVCVGDGPAARRARLEAIAGELGLGERVVWAEGRDDMPSVYSALDVLTLASAYGEGFPNVVAEAMACGVPCVVTDVGDAAAVVGDTGFVVPPGDPAMLANKVNEMLERLSAHRDAISAEVRRRVVENFSPQVLALNTQQALEKLLD